MLKGGLSSEGHKFFVYEITAFLHFFGEGQVIKVHFVKNYYDFAIDFVNSHQFFELTPLGDKLAMVDLFGCFCLQIFDAVNAPAQDIVNHHDMVIGNSCIFLHKLSLHRRQNAKEDDFLIASYLECRFGAVDDGEIKAVAGSMEKKVCCQEYRAFHWWFEFYVSDILSYILNRKGVMDFDFFEEAEKQKEPNLEQLIQEIHNQSGSIEFDRFDPVEDNDPKDKSFNSDFFFQPQPPQPEKVVSQKTQGKDESFDFQNSRNLSEISYQTGQSFRYEAPAPPFDGKSSQRYDRLQQMLQKAKTNNLDMFYKNLDQQNTYQVQDKFNSKEEFDDYRKKFKYFKRQLQEEYKEQKGNYNFRDNRYHFPEKGNDAGNPFLDQPDKDFRRKQSYQSQGSGSMEFQPVREQKIPQNAKQNSNNLLPAEYQNEGEEDIDFFMDEDQVNREVDKFKQQQYEKEAKNFFGEEEEGQKKVKKTKNNLKLSDIREERANLFEMTHEEQKMTKLLTNYEEMKANFHDLMPNLKNTSTDQAKIIRELNTLKQFYASKESKMRKQAETKQQQRLLREQQKQQKNKKLAEIKQQIQRVKEGGDKDLLYVKINQKIESLESIVKNAITTMNEQKQQKFIPKIINYYRDQEPRSSRSRQSNLGLSREEQVNQNEKEHERSQIQHLIQEQLAPIQEAIKAMKDERKEDQGLYNIEEFCSPLQLDLTSQEYPMNMSRDRSMQLETPFVPPEGAKQYLPNTLDQTNKYLRRCLTQKSSIIFESFEFYITGKFTITGNDRYPVLCEVRVANKCAVSLFDLLAIVFGPQAQEGQLQMRPPKIMHDQIKASSSFLFQVDLTKCCIQSGGFSVMLSYKTDTINKKKMIFKVTLPFVQLIKPEFIYEEQFLSGWNHMNNQQYIIPKPLDFKTIRNHEDLKLILPLVEITENDSNSFSYGIMFTYPTSTVVFMLKITCYVTGKASIHLKSSATGSGDKKLREEILDVMNYLCYGYA